MTTDERQSFIRSVRRQARIIGLKRLATRTVEAYARGNGSEAELAALLVREDALERSWTLDLPALPRRGDLN